MVDRALAAAVELDEVALVLDEADEVEVDVVVEVRGRGLARLGGVGVGRLDGGELGEERGALAGRLVAVEREMR